MTEQLAYAVSLFRGDASLWWRNIAQDVERGTRESVTWEQFEVLLVK